MASFDQKFANAALDSMIAEHQDVARKMTAEQIEGWSQANWPWLDGLIGFYSLDRVTAIKAACCWMFQWGVRWNQAKGQPVDAPIPEEVWKDPSNYKQRCVAFCDAIGALHPFIGKEDSLTVRPEYLP